MYICTYIYIYIYAYIYTHTPNQAKAGLNMDHTQIYGRFAVRTMTCDFPTHTHLHTDKRKHT